VLVKSALDFNGTSVIALYDEEVFMQHFSISPIRLFTSPWQNRALVKALIKREIVGRYRGSVMGILWSFIHPVLMLSVYTFVFSVVFKARWNTGSDSKVEFALVLFAGLLVFGLFSECINRAPSLILSNVNYVKKVVFPLEILPWIALSSAFFHMIISLIVWLIFYTVFFGFPHLTALLFPIILIPLVLFTMGLSWFLSSLGVYLRDVSQIVSVIMTTLMFVSPIFFPVSALPPAYQPLLMFNPLTPVIEMSRDALIWGKAPNWIFFGSYFIATLLVAYLGFAWFQKTRKGFADVL